MSSIRPGTRCALTRASPGCAREWGCRDDRRVLPLPQKRAAYALNPVQALQLLQRRVSELSDAEFHLAMTSIVTGLRDAHSRYSGPRSMQNSVAVLPFL